MLGAGDEARAGRETIGMRVEKSETKGSGRRKESTGWEDEGNGLEKEGLIPAPGQLPPDPGTPAELTSRLRPLDTSQTCRCGKDYFPQVLESILLWPYCSLTSNPGQIPNSSERKYSLPLRVRRLG